MLKLFSNRFLPNPRRVIMFLDELEVEIPTEEVNLLRFENRTTEFKKKNPLARVPLLQTEDGDFLAESIAICRYLDEHFENDRNLFGSSKKSRAFVEMWQRQIELDLLIPYYNTFRHVHPFFSVIPQVKEYGEYSKKRLKRKFDWLNHHLEQNTFIVGEHFSIADITAFISFDFFGTVTELQFNESHPSIVRWFRKISARKSVQKQKNLSIKLKKMISDPDLLKEMTP